MWLVNVKAGEKSAKGISLGFFLLIYKDFTYEEENLERISKILEVLKKTMKLRALINRKN